MRGDDERGVVRSLFIDLEDVSSMLWNLGLEMSDYYRLFMDARKLSTRDMDWNYVHREVWVWYLELDSQIHSGEGFILLQIWRSCENLYETRQNSFRHGRSPRNLSARIEKKLQLQHKIVIEYLSTLEKDNAYQRRRVFKRFEIEEERESTFVTPH